MTGPRVSAVVLAGGRSVRFGRDKLAEPIGGRPLLHHAIDGGRPVGSEVIVVAARGAKPSVPDGVTVVQDSVAFDGPLAGLLVGLQAAREPVVVVVGGDMPELMASVLGAMVAALEMPDADAVLLEHDGRPRPLPMVVRRAAALDRAAPLVGAGVRRLGALTDDLPTWIIDEPTWRALDPDAHTLRDIDTQDDLA
jgi:molybdopterin-guanine dinucleotide biosynthesis protein A